MIIKQDNHDYFSSGIMFTVILLISLERFQASYHSELKKLLMLEMLFIVMFLPKSFTAIVRDEFSSKISLVKAENYQIEFLAM